MRIAELSESSNFWTQIALLGNPWEHASSSFGFIRTINKLLMFWELSTSRCRRHLKYQIWACWSVSVTPLPEWAGILIFVSFQLRTLCGRTSLKKSWPTPRHKISLQGISAKTERKEVILFTKLEYVCKRALGCFVSFALMIRLQSPLDAGNHDRVVLWRFGLSWKRTLDLNLFSKICWGSPPSFYRRALNKSCFRGTKTLEDELAWKSWPTPRHRISF